MTTENVPTGVELREQRRERNAREIQQTAISLFAERGYAAVTVDDIAREAGISERTFFRYFASKDHLLVAEASRRIDVILESLVRQDDALDAWQALRNAVLDQSASEERIGRNAAIWAHLTSEAPALLAKMIMHGALEGTHNIEVELARRLRRSPTSCTKRSSTTSSSCSPRVTSTDSSRPASPTSARASNGETLTSPRIHEHLEVDVHM